MSSVVRALRCLADLADPLAPDSVSLFAPLNSLPFQAFLESPEDRPRALSQAVQLVVDDLSARKVQYDGELANMLRTVYLEPRGESIGKRRRRALSANPDTALARNRKADDLLAQYLLDPAFAPRVERNFGVVHIPPHLRERATVAHRMTVVEHEIELCLGDDPRVHHYTFRLRLRAAASGIRVYTHRQRWTGRQDERREPAIRVVGNEQSFIGSAHEARGDVYELLFFYLGRPLEQGEETQLEWSETLTDDAGHADPHLQVEIRYPRTRKVRLIMKPGPQSLEGDVDALVLQDIHVVGSTGVVDHDAVQPDTTGRYIAEWHELTLGQCHRLRWPRLYPDRHR